MSASPRSFLEILDPFVNPAYNERFHRLQQSWSELGTTPFHELTADSTLIELLWSTCLTQKAAIEEIFLYGLVLRGGKMLMLKKPGQPGETLTAPCSGTTVTADFDGSVKIRDAVVRFLHEEIGVACDPASVYLTKAILPVAERPTVVAVVRLEAETTSTGASGEWLTYGEIEQLPEEELQPEGVKNLILEAVEQRRFEDAVLDL